MRKELEVYQDKKIRVQGTFHHFGYTRKNGISVLLNHVKIGEELLSEHVWIAYCEEFKTLAITKGDVLEFDAYVREYQKIDGTDYGFDGACDFRVIHCVEINDTIEDMAYRSFSIKKYQKVWQSIKGEKQSFLHDENREIQQDIHILNGDEIEIELYRLKEYGIIEFVWCIKREGRWNKGALFNPIKYGQAIVIYNSYQIFLPESIYFELKDFYFKVYYSKTNLVLPYQHTMMHYQKPKKFKNRKVIFYDKHNCLITNQEVIKKREYLFYELEYMLTTMDSSDIDALFMYVYQTNVHIKAYFSQTSSYFMQKDFLVSKTMNCFRSASIEEKRKYIDYMEGYVKSLEEG